MKRRALRDALFEIRRENEEVFSEKYLIHHLFEDAKYFLEAAKEHEQTNVLISRRYVRAAVISAFAGLEALVNTFCELIAERGDLELHERAFAQERRVELAEEGYFEIRGQRFYSLDDRLKFLHWRFKGLPISERAIVWKFFLEAKKLRNSLVHPKPGQVSYSGQTIRTAKSCVIAVFRVAQMLGWPEESSLKTERS